MPPEQVLDAANGRCALPPVLLVAHGSRDPAAAATARALARMVAALVPGLDVQVAFLDHAAPRPVDVLPALVASASRLGCGPPIVVPLLLTEAFHGRVDLPAQVAGFEVTITGALGGPNEWLLRALAERLAEAADGWDGVVLAAAGTRVVAARRAVTEVAAALEERWGVPVLAAYAAATGPTGGEATAVLRGLGSRRVVVASYFLARGWLYDTIATASVDSGAVAVAEPLGASADLARLILARVGSVLASRRSAVAGAR